MWIDSFVPTELSCGSCLWMNVSPLRVWQTTWHFCQCANTGGEKFSKEIFPIKFIPKYEGSEPSTKTTSNKINSWCLESEWDNFTS